ncbi:hypothetical protein M9H77_29974 [Catharanthus roseus]|uniref:Uncharacterized protein n=1 Tax=Catharanthus roseus TaxID=4058 RepID=A0ACB9ZYI6_CATRO|nr:hypothetical protein M9H77_29974 [Catharanthus roseus]
MLRKCITVLQSRPTTYGRLSPTICYRVLSSLFFLWPRPTVDGRGSLPFLVSFYFYFVLPPGSTADAGENGQGICTIRFVRPTTSAKETVGRHVIRRILGKELKVNAECLLIESGSPMPTNKQLMFEAASGSSKGHVYDFGSQSAAITIEQWGGSSSSSLVP